jgi:DNA repair protein SbcC/Rad50
MVDFTLLSVEVEGFRGFNSRQKFPLDNQLTLISGDNGVGKSSLLGGIEWCLYGDVAYINYLDSKVRDELVNQSHPRGMASVSLTLRRGSETYRIERDKELGTRSTHLTLKGPSGQFDDDLAEDEVYKIFGLTLDDFIRAVYLHQESIRGLLTDDPRIRDEALDRLFGLDRLRNLVEGIPIKKIKDEVDELNGKKEKLGEKIKGALTQIQADLGKLREKAKGLGLAEDEVKLEKAVELCESVRGKLTTLAKDYGLPGYPIPAPSETAQLGGFERKVKTILKEYETAIIGGTDSSKLYAQKRELEELLENRRKSIDGKTAKKQQASDLASTYGSPDEIGGRLSKLDTAIKDLEGERKDLDVHSRLIEDAIQELGSATVPACPVCNQPINHDQVLSRLKAESERHFGEEVRQLDEKRASLEKEVKDLRGELDDFNEVIVGLKESDEAISAIDSTLARILATHTKDNELVMAAAGRVQELQRGITETEKAYSTRAKEIQEVRQFLELISAIAGVLERALEFNEVNRHFEEESSQIQSIDSAVAELQKFERTLETIVRAVSEVQVGLASDMIKRAEDGISSFYTRLCNHPYYDRIRVEVRPRELRGLVRNSYSIRAFNSREGKETFVSSRFSTGQMNCVALAIYLSLTKVLPVGLSFMLLDDPSQNLDPSHKKALANILKDVLEGRQVIVASQDSELLSFLQSEIGPNTNYRFSDWTAEGPKVTVERNA